MPCQLLLDIFRCARCRYDRTAVADGVAADLGDQWLVLGMGRWIPLGGTTSEVPIWFSFAFIGRLVQLLIDRSF